MKKKVLIIGQLPAEIGGNYTTGVANVVYELIKCNYSNTKIHLFATNLPSRKSTNLPKTNCEVFGYKFRFIYFSYRFIGLFYKILNDMIGYKKIGLNPFRYIFYQLNLDYLINKIKPDIIHSHGLAHYLPLYNSVLNKIPILVTFHGVFYKGNKETESFKRLYLKSASSIKYSTVLTKEMKNEAVNFLGLNSDNIKIIHNGVDTKKFYYDINSRIKIRSKFNLSKNDRVFITVGSLQKRKGQLKFLNYLHKSGIDFHYWMIGQGEDNEEINDYIVKNSLEEKVKVFGYISNDKLKDYYSAADIYAHVSFAEGQALSEIEASATGLKVLFNNEIKGTIVADLNLENYYLFDYCNVNKISLINWIHSSNIRKSNYNMDWQNMATLYEKTYIKY